MLGVFMDEWNLSDQIRFPAGMFCYDCRKKFLPNGKRSRGIDVEDVREFIKRLKAWAKSCVNYNSLSVQGLLEDYENAIRHLREPMNEEEKNMQIRLFRKQVEENNIRKQFAEYLLEEIDKLAGEKLI